MLHESRRLEGRFAKPAGRDRRHPTQKPLGLLGFLVRSYSLPGQTVLDTFAGSASTLQAAVAAGRYAIGIERDTAFYVAAVGHLEGLGVHLSRSDN